jgi:hypothetical protein
VRGDGAQADAGTLNGWPLRTIGGNGEPAPMMARPSLQRSISAGVASAQELGFDSGKMIGRLLCLAMARTTDSVKAPVCAETPISAVGFAL